MSALDTLAGNVVPIYECEFSIGQPVHVIPTTPEEDPEQVWYVVGINWEYRDVIGRGWNITLATADDIKKRYGQTDGYRPQDLLPALTAAGYTIVRKDEVRDVPMREVLLFASYCGDDNTACSDVRPCPICLGMSNVVSIPASTPLVHDREFEPRWFANKHLEVLNSRKIGKAIRFRKGGKR